MSALGLGCVKTPALAADVETFWRNFQQQGQRVSSLRTFYDAHEGSPNQAMVHPKPFSSSRQVFPQSDASARHRDGGDSNQPVFRRTRNSPIRASKVTR
jgi:hypothetical protein